MPAPPAIDVFSVSIEQDGVTVPPKDHVVRIRKDTFGIVVRFPVPDEILVNASFNPASFDAARDGKPFKEIPGFFDLGMAEGTFNEGLFLFVSDHAPNAWYYKNENDHRFDSVTLDAGIITCRRTIARVIFQDSDKAVAVKDLTRTGLYLVFMHTEWTADYSEQIETRRDYLEIVFD
jgi:hypothetical protein